MLSFMCCLLLRKIHLFKEHKGVVSKWIFLHFSRIWGLLTSYSPPQPTRSDTESPLLTATLMLVHLTGDNVFLYVWSPYPSQWNLSSARLLSLYYALILVWRQFQYLDNNTRAVVSLYFSSRFKKRKLSAIFFSSFFCV